MKEAKCNILFRKTSSWRNRNISESLFIIKLFRYLEKWSPDLYYLRIIRSNEIISICKRIFHINRGSNEKSAVCG